MVFCIGPWIFVVILAAEWFLILYYCRMKFKIRYALATVTTFLTMAVYIHIAFNCIYATKTRQLSNLHQLDERDYDPRVRSVNYDSNHRDLLQKTEATDHLDLDNTNMELYQIYEKYFQEKKKIEDEEGLAELGLERNEDPTQDANNTSFIPMQQTAKFEQTKHVASVHENHKKTVESPNKSEFNTEEMEAYLVRKMEENLRTGIYNNKSHAVVIMDVYRNMANQITHENSQQQKDIRGLSHVKLQQAWDEVKNRVPLTTAEVLEKFGNFLPWWEQIEITYYSKIYYLGLKAEKSMFINNLTRNFGFDNDPDKGEKERMFFVNIGDHIAYRYEIIETLGSGGYGLVVLAHDHKLRMNVAVKFIRNKKDWDFDTVDREYRMDLKISAEAPRKNYFPIIYEHFMFRNHKCVAMELLGEPLHPHYPMHNMTLLRRYAFDVLNGMVDLEKMSIIHADLKTGNILYLNSKSNTSNGQLFKIVDFSLSCIKDSEEYVCPGSHIQTMSYKCPEVLINLPYNSSCDMYSFGIVLGKIYLGKYPIRGETNTDQLAATMEVLGVLPEHMVAASPWIDIYQEAMCYVKKNGFKRRPYRKSLGMIFEGMPGDLFDLLKQILVLDPAKRITASQALSHPFITDHIGTF